MFAPQKRFYAVLGLLLMGSLLWSSALLCPCAKDTHSAVATASEGAPCHSTKETQPKNHDCGTQCDCCLVPVPHSSSHDTLKIALHDSLQKTPSLDVLAVVATATPIFYRSSVFPPGSFEVLQRPAVDRPVLFQSFLL